MPAIGDLVRCTNGAGSRLRASITLSCAGLGLKTVGWEEVEVPRPLIAARCSRCYQLAAKYYWADSDEQGAWESDAPRRGGCKCDPPPTLPEGDELAQLIARARRKPAAWILDAPLIIRV
jgi:hypothetical protein